LVLQDLLFATLAAIWLLAPLAALLWFNWRAAVFGSLAFGCLGVFPLAMFAAGNSAWQPGGHPLAVMLACWVVAAAVLVVTVRLSGRTWLHRLGSFLLGVAVSSWMLTFYPAAETFWSVVGTPK
jgi:hypothetical protein